MGLCTFVMIFVCQQQQAAHSGRTIENHIVIYIKNTKFYEKCLAIELVFSFNFV